MNDEETRRTVELEKYFSILPAFKGFYNDINYRYPDQLSESITKPYISNSEDCLGHSKLPTFWHSLDCSESPPVQYIKILAG